jgi:hypothetical protein
MGHLNLFVGIFFFMVFPFFAKIAFKLEILLLAGPAVRASVAREAGAAGGALRTEMWAVCQAILARP